MKIGTRSHDGAEDRLQFARQVGADGASIRAAACPGYTEQCYLTVDNVLEMKERFEKYDLELRRAPAGPVSFARISTDDVNGRIRTYVADGIMTNGPLDTFQRKQLGTLLRNLLDKVPLHPLLVLTSPFNGCVTAVPLATEGRQKTERGK